MARHAVVTGISRQTRELLAEMRSSNGESQCFNEEATPLHKEEETPFTMRKKLQGFPRPHALTLLPRCLQERGLLTFRYNGRSALRLSCYGPVRHYGL
jgi:hypothetical protein